MSVIGVAVKNVKVTAADAGLPESVVERHMDTLCQMAIRFKSQERKHCKNQLRKWVHESPLDREPLTDILNELDGLSQS